MTPPQSIKFGQYFTALHGHEPFPWQQHLAETILETGVWPPLLDIPTGLGKTSAIDVALFTLAVRPEIAPRRIILVVDRRVVVDQAADHARKIQHSLRTAREGSLASVARALRRLWDGPDDAPPFEVGVLRGGMPRDEAWAHRPDRPVVALSTVDQVGSRLLFRGYGVSPGMAPVHAGLLGQDALIMLDEVQLSTAFAETLHAIGERWRPWRESAARAAAAALEIPDRWAFVRMSATPVGTAGRETTRFRLSEGDLAHPVVQQRLNASKLATLGQPVVAARSIGTFSSEACRHLEAGAKRLAVIVNRVALARQVHEDLKQRIGPKADTVLLTGRMRPLDRTNIFGSTDDPTSVAARVTAGAPRVAGRRPIIVVSTQTIEAGADFDFDALVTECASLDALRQRFGRLDRRGEIGQTRATILIRKDQARDSEDDPVYGAALGKTWNWLQDRADATGTVDFGIASFPFPTGDAKDLEELCSPVRHAPVMLPAHIDAWAQTNPRGKPDPDVALWLHGPDRGLAEVRVIWRADVDSKNLNDPTSEVEANVERYATASLAVAPPSSLESISVPLPAFRDWLANRAAGELTDVEAASSDLSGNVRRRDDEQLERRAFLIVTKAGAKVCRTANDAYPEATIVVPSGYGGIRDGNWNPRATEPVSDLGDWAQFVHRGRPVLRLVPQLTHATRRVGKRGRAEEGGEADGESSGALLPAAVAESIPMVPEVDDPEYRPRNVVHEWLVDARTAGSDNWKLVANALTQKRAQLRIVQLEGSPYYAVIGRRRLDLHREPVLYGFDLASDIVNDDDDSASHIGREVGLEEHLGDVERWAQGFSKNVDLPETLAHDLALAARLHDIGKADARFQRMLHGGSPVRLAASDQLLAKSRGNASDRAARKQARIRSGYPVGYRHELLSVAMLEGTADALARANDPELVLHLVGSHHGWCRPFAPALADGPSGNVELVFDDTHFAANTAHGLAMPDSGVAERYWLLTERYGWWTLAWFEALVRLADHRASEESSLGKRSSARAGAATVDVAQGVV